MAEFRWSMSEQYDIATSGQIHVSYYLGSALLDSIANDLVFAGTVPSITGIQTDFNIQYDADIPGFGVTPSNSGPYMDEMLNVSIKFDFAVLYDVSDKSYSVSFTGGDKGDILRARLTTLSVADSPE